MKTIYLLFFSIIILFSACLQKNKKSKEQINNNDTSIVSPEISTQISLEVKKESIIDSLNKNYNGSYKKQYLYSIEKLFNYNNIGFDLKYLDLKFFSEIIKIYKFNDYFLTSINYDSYWSHESRNEIVIYLLDENNNIVINDTIRGCHYHNGEIKIIDWDKDKKEDIVFTIDYPTQSIPHLISQLTVYSFDIKTNLFYEKFYLELEERNCFEKKDSCIFIERFFTLSKDRKTIEIKENTYTFDVEDMQWENTIKNKQIINKTKYFYILNENLIYKRKNEN